MSEVVRKTRHDFHGKDYDLLSKNCNHFSDHLIYNLTNGQHRLPKKINDLANTSHKVASTAMGALGGLLRVGLEVADQIEAHSSGKRGPQERVEELN